MEGAFAPIGGAEVGAKDANNTSVTLLSYNNNNNNNNNAPRRIFQKSQNNNNNNTVTKVFKTLRRRSKSASRLNKRSQLSSSEDFKGSDCSLNQIDNRYNILSDNDDSDVKPITYNCNGEKLSRNPESLSGFAAKPDKVTLIGFSTPNQTKSSLCDSQSRFDKSKQVSGRNRLRKRSNYDFGGSAHNLSTQDNSSTNFATLKTSREVKMERERLRQERLRLRKQLMEASNELSNQHQNSHPGLMMLHEERERFFREAREEFARRNLASSEMFSQFVRDNQERFQQLVQHKRNSSTGAESYSSSSGSSSFNSSSSGAATAFSRKQQQQQQQQQSSSKVSNGKTTHFPKVHHIKIQREDLECEEIGNSDQVRVTKRSDSKVEFVLAEQDQEPGNADEEKLDADKRIAENNVQRSLSNSSRLSSSSSGISSLEEREKKYSTSSSKASSIKTSASAAALTKLQQLQERRAAFYHPTFANHFGFGRPGTGLRANVNSFSGLTSGFGSDGSLKASRTSKKMSADNGKADKIKIAKSKSSTMESTSSSESSNDGRNFRFNSEEVSAMASSYGDSETESDEDEDDDDDENDILEDLENLDSISINQTQTTTRRIPIIVQSSNKADADSGRGDSPESSCSNSNVKSRVATTKRPRPISAVPSEFSDISTTSCRSAGSSEGATESTITAINKDDQEADPKIDSNQESTEAKTELTNGDSNANNKGEDDPDDRRTALEKAHRIAVELLTTEEQYVSVLHLIDQVFHFRVDQENRAQHLFPPEMLPQMFANVKSIYKFHAEFLLPQLRERMSTWDCSDESTCRIGDVIVKFSPFFKMYTEYVKNFDHAVNTVNAVYAKNARFAAIMDEIHAMPECRNLSLQHHMLTPIQRIPRYEMMLKDYLRKIPEDAIDRPDAEKALHLVSTAATHANDAMKRIEKFKKLLEVQEALGSSAQVDLVSPTRELVREGRIVKISARSGDHQDRYLFLFSDLLLLCSPRLRISAKLAAANQNSNHHHNDNELKPASYRLRARFSVSNMQVLEGDNPMTENTFHVRDDHKSVELYTQTREEKDEWLEALFRSIKELYQKKASLKQPWDNGIQNGQSRSRKGSSNSNHNSSGEDEMLGRNPPKLVRPESISKCMAECGQPFTMMRKRHNCRACGIVVCAKCSGQKFPLTYEDNKLCRVCRGCFHQLILNQKHQLEDAVSSSSAEDLMLAAVTADQGQNGDLLQNGEDDRPKGLLEVPARAPSIMSGYLTILNSKSKKDNNRIWHSLRPDFVLYSFSSEDAKSALTATPVPGCSILSDLQDYPDDAQDSSLVIRMSFAHPILDREYSFQADDQREARRWIRALKLASKAETPDQCQSEENEQEQKSTTNTSDEEKVDKESLSNYEDKT